jgi:hypothetical protein
VAVVQPRAAAKVVVVVALIVLTNRRLLSVETVVRLLVPKPVVTPKVVQLVTVVVSSKVLPVVVFLRLQKTPLYFVMVVAK